MFRVNLRLVPVVLFALAACSCASQEHPPTVVSANPGVQAVSAADNDFGFRLLHRLAADQPTGNVFFSPFSISQALTLTMDGAGGKTRQAMAKTLGLGNLPQDKINAANALLLPSLENPDPEVEVSVANALWANQDVTLSPAFQADAKQFYQAQTATLDFRAPSAPDTINNWVSTNTQGKITQIVSPNDLAASSVMLTNAVYFHGLWQLSFDKAATQNAPFSLTNGLTTTVPLMVQENSFSYLQTPQFQAASLPYGAGRMSLLVFLPAPKTSLSAFGSQLDSRRVSQWVGAMTATRMTLFLPRFKADYGVKLNAPLSALGMGSAFAHEADFAPMGMSHAYLDAVLHKAVLEVDEEGTTAAAATSVAVTARSAPAPPRTTMRVDRPFFCMIRDNATGVILFEGLIRDSQ